MRELLYTGATGVNIGVVILNQNPGSSMAYVWNPLLVEPIATQMQTLTIVATGGTFTLSYAGQTTAGISYAASASTIATALNGLSSIPAACSFSVTGTGTFTITPVGANLLGSATKITANGASLTGAGASATVTSAGTYGGWEALVAARASDYLIVLTEYASTGVYVGDWPSNVPGGNYALLWYHNSTPNALSLPSDPLINQSSVNFNGSVLQSFANQTTHGANQTATAAAIASTNADVPNHYLVI